jgi:hypothetical protein
LGAGEEDAVGAVLAAVVEVDGVGSVQVGSRRSSVSITVPELLMSVKFTSTAEELTYSAGVVSSIQMEIVCRFAQTVQVRGLRQTRPEPEILRLEDQTGRRRIEQRLVRLSPRDSKRERVRRVRKHQRRARRINAILALRAGPDGLLDLEHLLGGIVDLDVDAVFCLQLALLFPFLMSNWG